MSEAAGQVEASLRYIRETYGRRLTLQEAEAFFEEDEDPAKILAAYDAGPKFLTRAPQPYECGFCSRGECSRCSDRKCACCAGNED